MPHLNSGDVVDQSVSRRQGPKLNQVEISTPCCQITYRIDVAEIDRYYRSMPMQIRCGKLRRQRGRTRPDSGCDWTYHVTFTRNDQDTIVRAHWKVGRW